MITPHSFGRFFNFTVFGESHGSSIGVVIEGLPAGIKLDLSKIRKELDRRKPGQSKISTPRKEEDYFEILSGFHEGYTSGGPLTFIIRNTNVRSKDYSIFRKIPRPSHVDYPALLRYGEHVDLRGSGKFSGRLTAPIVIAGAIAKQLLEERNIKVAAWVSQIGSIVDERVYTVDEIVESVEKTPVRTVNQDVAEEMIALIENIRKEHDSIGGCVSVRVENFPAGIGDPLFHSLEGDLASAILSIPATRGIEFGAGFKAAFMRGSEHNDPYLLEQNRISTRTNHCGGIIGGISIGTPIEFRVPIKPTASIGHPQQTLDFKEKHITTLKIEGRHDPCIVPRALVAIEAITCCVLLDHLFASRLYSL